MNYSQKVEKIQRELQQKSGLLTLSHKNPSHTLRHGYQKKGREIDLSVLDEIIEIDEKALVATCESRVTIYDLCIATLKKGLMPLVVPEFKSITVGGAVMGAALESTSFCHGQFNDSCIEMDLLLGDGTLLTASKELHPDLFYGISGSYGTLALLLRAKIALKRVLPLVHLRYHHFTSPEEIALFFRETKADFLEGIMLEKKRFVAVVGKQATSSLPLKRLSQRSYASKWYIDHVRTRKEGHEELMSIKEYLFRFDRGAFWIGKTLEKWPLLVRSLLRFDLQEVARRVKKESMSSSSPSLLFRLLFGWNFGSKSLYKIWHRVPKEILEKLFFIHDFYTPVENFVEVLNSFQEQSGILPVWLCPLKGTLAPQFLSPHFGKGFFINIGLYGIPQIAHPKELTKTLEKEIVSKGGRKMLYSYTYYEREEFENIYSGEKYSDLRKKYRASGVFPLLYEKVTS